MSIAKKLHKTLKDIYRGDHTIKLLGLQEHSLIWIYVSLLDAVVKSNPESMDWIQEEYDECDGNPDVWFYRFHKLIRQADLIYGVKISPQYKLPLSEEEQAQKDALHKELTEGRKRLGSEAYWSSNEYKEQRAEYNKLRRKEVPEEVSYGGLDSIFWEVIHLDKTGLLLRAMDEVLKPEPVSKPINVKKDISDIEKFCYDIIKEVPDFNIGKFLCFLRENNVDVRFNPLNGASGLCIDYEGIYVDTKKLNEYPPDMRIFIILHEVSHLLHYRKLRPFDGLIYSSKEEFLKDINHKEWFADKMGNLLFRKFTNRSINRYQLNFGNITGYKNITATFDFNKAYDAFWEHIFSKDNWVEIIKEEILIDNTLTV